MAQRTKTNPQLTRLITLLKDTSREHSVNVWRDIAVRFEAPRSRYAEVNLSKINRYASDGETILVPGKVLGSGILEAPVKVAALQFSASAQDKIQSVNGECMSIEELLSANPKGSRVRILR
jgi:large subunit ribosomal protein L18e